MVKFQQKKKSKMQQEFQTKITDIQRDVPTNIQSKRSIEMK